MSYITNKLVGTVSLNGDIVPTSNVSNLGSNTHTFGNLYIGSQSILISNPNPSVAPTDLTVRSDNLFTISRGGLAVVNETGAYDIFQVDPNGTITIRSNIVASPTTPALSIIGNQSGYTVSPDNTGVMLQVTGLDSSPSRIYNDSYGTDTYSAFIGRNANGTAGTPLQVLAGDIVARFGANPYATSGGPGNGPGFAPNSTTRIDMAARENQTGTTRGSNIQLWTTPLGSNVTALVATFNNDGIQLISNVNIGTDLTVNGNAIIIGTGTSYGNLITYGNLISYGNTITQGTLTTFGNTQISGDSQFSGNLIALRGIVFSDGSNVTTAGVSNVSAGAGISVSAGIGYSVTVNNTGVRQVYGTANQITVNANTGNVQLSLPQDLAPSSNPFFGNLTVGNLTVTGNITSATASDLQVTNRVIYAANGATTTSAMNLGGFVLGNSEVAASMLYTASNDSWNFNKDVIIPGNIFVSGDLHSTTAEFVSNIIIGSGLPIVYPASPLQITSDVAGAQPVTNQNTSGDSQASTDWVALSDTGNAYVNYIDLGINSSTYNVAEYSINGPSDGYLFNNGGNLTIGTQTVNKQIKFHTGGTQAGNIAAFVTQGGRWVFGGADNGTDKVQIAGSLNATGNVNADDINANSVTATAFNGTIAQASQPNITSVGALLNLNVNGSLGVQGSMNVIGTQYSQNIVANVGVYGQVLNIAGAAQVNQLISNIEITTGRITATGTIRTDRLIANTAIQSIATLTAQSIVNNTGIQTATLNVTGAAQVDSMTTNLLTTTNTFNVVGLSITNSQINNTGVTTSTLNATNGAIVNSLNSNTNVVATNIQSTGLLSAASVVANANIFGATINTSGAARFASIISNAVMTGTTIQGTALVNGAAITSNTTIQSINGIISDTYTGNTSVTAPTVNATTTLQSGSINSNTTIQAIGLGRFNSLVTNASAYANNVTVSTFVQAGSMISNAGITAATVNSTGAALVNSLNSNTNVVGVNLQSTGQATVASLVSNASIAGTTINGTALTVTTIQDSGSALVNSLTSNVYGLFGQNVTVNSTNTSISTTTGALTVAGGVGVAGNVYAQSVTLSAGTASQYPLKFNSAAALLTPTQAGVVNYDGTVFYATPSGLQRGVIPTEQVYALNVPYTYTPGSGAATSLFGVSPATTANTRYQFVIQATVLHGTNNGTLALSFGGVATVNQILYQSTAWVGALGTPSTNTLHSVASSTATATNLVGTNIAAGTPASFIVQGIIEIGATGGTLTPLIGWSVTPGLVTVGNLSQMRLYPISTNTGNTAVGSWT